MDSIINLYFERAENELTLAKAIKLLSDNTEIKNERFDIAENMTFYSAVISHAYYAIFYSAKAYLVSKGIAFKSKQGQHQKVHFEFRKLVQKGILSKELLEIYEEAKIKAELLLEILDKEKTKRTEFTYEKLPQANMSPAEDSIENATIFVSNMKAFIQNQSEQG